MSVLAIIIYGLFGLGYLAMIVKTESSAEKYVSGQVRIRPRTTVVVVPAPVAEPSHAHARVSEPVRIS